MVAAAFCAMSFAQLAGWLPWVWRWGYNSKPHAHLACGCARPEP
ncbi:putative quinol dehydrogenase periplasmic component [Escherichia coli]|nr:putative quinol dehydrogenase periplasmic component [Escherichia coli]